MALYATDYARRHPLQIRVAIFAAVFLTSAALVFAVDSLGRRPDPQLEAWRIFEKCGRVSFSDSILRYVSSAYAHEGRKAETNTENDCIVHEFVDLAEKEGFDFVVNTITAFQDRSPDYQSCHLLAHEIAQGVAARSSGEALTLLDEVDPRLCGGGFVHGVLEIQAGRDPDFEINAGLFNKLCGGPLRKAATSCAHILGHLALVESFGNIEKAFNSCDGLKGEFLFECYGGLFMEDSFRINLIDHGFAEPFERNAAWLDEQVARCRAYEKEGSPIVDGCWYDLAEVFAQTSYYDPVQTYKLCFGAPTQEAWERCSVRASYLIALAPLPVFNNSYLPKLCADYEGKGKVYAECMRQVVGALMSNSLSFTERAVGFCGGLSDRIKSECFAAIGQWLFHYAVSEEEKKVLCGLVPREYRDSCVLAGNISG